jgi:hypothetical protein
VGDQIFVFTSDDTSGKVFSPLVGGESSIWVCNTIPLDLSSLFYNGIFVVGNSTVVAPDIIYDMKREVWYGALFQGFANRRR